MLCQICKEVTSRYKCSTCFIRYCSVACWRNHKNSNCCQNVENSKENISLNSEIKYFTEDTISEKKLSMLGESKELKMILNNKYLQDILLAVDTSTNPEKAVCESMKNPEFVKFVDECLKIIDDGHSVTF